MAFVIPTLVQGTATAIGTSNAVLTDQPGTVSWSTLADGSTVDYVIQDNPPDAFYEWGLGTKSTSAGLPVLQRMAGNVLGGSSGVGVLVNFTAAHQVIYAAPVGERSCITPNLTADPTVSSLGQVVYRTDTNDLRVYSGSSPAWHSIVRSDNLLSSFGLINASRIFAGPTFGSATPTFRTLVKADQFSTTAYTDAQNIFNTTGKQVIETTDAITNAISTVFQLDHESTGTPAVGFGGGVQFLLGDSATIGVTAAEFDWLWTNATDGNQLARGILYVYDSTAAREGLRIESDGTNALLGIGSTVASNTRVTLTTGADANTGIVVLANSSSQSAVLQGWQVTSGNNRARITAAGEFSNPSPNDCSGSSNEVFGFRAGASLTSGSGNVLIGREAGFNLQIGVHNVFVGQQAGNRMVNGSDNFALGFGSLLSSDDGGNVAIGSQTLYNLNGGSFNIAIGKLSGENCTTAGCNVFVGYQTAQGLSPGGSSVTSGVGNTLIGYEADVVDGTQNYGIGLGYQSVCQVGEFALSPKITFQTFYGLSSTSTLRQRADFTISAVDNTDATRKYRIIFNAWDTAARECIRLEGGGSAAKMSVFGVATVTQQSTTGTTQQTSAGSGTAIKTDSTSTGGTGSTAYTTADVILALKNFGILAV